MFVSLDEVALHLTHLGHDAQELAMKRNDASRAQTAFLKQRSDATATQTDFALQLRLRSHRQTARFELLPRREIALEQALDSGEVRGNALLNLLLRVRLGRADAHGAIKGQLLSMHVAEDLDRFARRVIALEHLAAEDHARGFDLLGQTDFFFACQQRDRAHLREVHANRIVNALRALLGERLLDGRLHFAVVENVLLNVEVIGIWSLFFALGFPVSGLLLALVLLDLKLGRSECRRRRLRRT